MKQKAEHGILAVHVAQAIVDDDAERLMELYRLDPMAQRLAERANCGPHCDKAVSVMTQISREALDRKRKALGERSMDEADWEEQVWGPDYESILAS